MPTRACSSSVTLAFRASPTRSAMSLCAAKTSTPSRSYCSDQISCPEVASISSTFTCTRVPSSLTVPVTTLPMPSSFAIAASWRRGSLNCATAACATTHSPLSFESWLVTSSVIPAAKYPSPPLEMFSNGSTASRRRVACRRRWRSGRLRRAAANHRPPDNGGARERNERSIATAVHGTERREGAADGSVNARLPEPDSVSSAKTRSRAL